MHKPSIFRLTLISPLVLLSSCGSSHSQGSFAELVERDFDRLNEREVSLLDRADPGSAAAPTRDQIPHADTADGYVKIALERNPSILAAQQRVLRLRERVPQATSLDDPTLQITPIGEMADTAAGQVRVMTSISQKLPSPGKLDTRGKIAELDAAIAEKDLERVRLSVIADTRRAYWSLYYAVRAVEVTSESRDLLSTLLEVAQAKYRAGTTSQQAVLRASVELNNLASELIELEQRKRSAVAMLNSLIDRPVDAPLPDPPRVTLTAFEAQLDALLAISETNNPTIKALHDRLEQHRARRDLANLGRRPDFTVSASYNIVDDEGLSPVSNGDDQWWLGFGFTLPIWADRNDAAEREATRGVLETAGLLASEKNRIAFRVQDAYANVESQQRQAALLEQTIIPEARQTVEAALSGYRAGEVDFLTLIDNWRQLLDFELMLQSNLTQFEQRIAELEEAVGRDLDRKGSPQSNSSGDTTNKSTLQTEGAQ